MKIVLTVAPAGLAVLMLTTEGHSELIQRARALGLTSFAVLGFTGGEALELANHPIYFPVHDMQVAVEWCSLTMIASKSWPSTLEV